MKFPMVLLSCLVLISCGIEPSNAATAQASMRQPVAAPLSHVKAPSPPSALPIGFSNVPPGTYAVHLHSMCSGRQTYHLAYLPDLAVGSAHTGQILVPAADFGRGWCVIVYSDAARNVVLATHAI